MSNKINNLKVHQAGLGLPSPSVNDPVISRRLEIIEPTCGSFNSRGAVIFRTSHKVRT